MVAQSAPSRVETAWGASAPLGSLRFAQTALGCNELLAIKKQLPNGNCQGEPRSPTIPLAGMETPTIGAPVTPDRKTYCTWKNNNPARRDGNLLLQQRARIDLMRSGNTTIPLAGMETLY